MRKSPIALSVLVGLALPCAALAGELAPFQAETLVLGDYTASVYYTAHDGRYEVVTTVAPNESPEGAPMRFTGSLGAGERQTISIGAFDTTSAPHVLELLHDGDGLVATLLPQDLT